jgi:hypothetical protein
VSSSWDEYRFGRARDYWLVHNGRKCDSKAIAGVAHGFIDSRSQPLQSNEFPVATRRFVQYFNDLVSLSNPVRRRRPIPLGLEMRSYSLSPLYPCWMPRWRIVAR